MKKFYIASSFDNMASVRFLAEALSSKEFILTYNWTLNKKANSIEALTTIGELEINAVRESDFLILLLPAGKGSHIEFGIALGNQVRTYIYSEKSEGFDLNNTPTYYHVKGVHRFNGSLEDFASYILELER